MRQSPLRKLYPPAVLAALLLAGAAWAGDPIPEIDVVLEQIPGGLAKLDSPTGGFDEIEIDVGKDFAKALSATALPPGWALEAKGKTVRLAGPAVPAGQPVRFKLDAGSAPRPRKISYRASLEGRKLLERRNEPVELVPPQQVIGSLQGIVTMPTQVEPGKPMQMRVAETAALPAGGTWSLSGTVVEEEEAQESAGDAPRRVALVVPAGAEIEGSQQVLQDVIAVLAARGAPEGTWEVTALADGDAILGEEGVAVWAVSRQGAARDLHTTSTVMKMKHDAAMSAVRNIRAALASAGDDEVGPLYGVRPVDGAAEAVGAFLLLPEIRGGDDLGDEDDEERPPEEDPHFPPIPGDLPRPDPTGPPLGVKEETKEDGKEEEETEACVQDSVPTPKFKFERLPMWHEIEGNSKPSLELIEVEDTKLVLDSCMLVFGIDDHPGGGKIHSFGIGSRVPVDGGKAPVRTAATAADGTVLFDLPDDLAPGGELSLQYLDIYGDVVIDVPSVPGVEVVEPTTNGAARITDATPRTFAGQQACVCGSFPGPAAWNGLLLDGEALGPPVSASSRMAWVQLPAGLAPGEHVVTGAPEPGFPAEDRATVLVVEVGGEIDSSKLQRMETTPMRLWVVGTSEPTELRVRNKTPAIISIEGGADQVIRTSGGEPNVLQRTVRGLSPGAFDIGYELEGAGCPCAASGEGGAEGADSSSESPDGAVPHDRGSEEAAKDRAATEVDVVVRPTEGAVAVVVDASIAVVTLRLWLPPGEGHEPGDIHVPPGWTVSQLGDGSFELNGPPTLGLEVRVASVDPEEIRVALQRAPAGDRRKGSLETLGNTIVLTECCHTVPCPELAAGGGRETHAGKQDQLLGGANPLQGLNVAKPSCQKCEPCEKPLG